MPMKPAGVVRAHPYGQALTGGMLIVAGARRPLQQPAPSTSASANSSTSPGKLRQLQLTSMKFNTKSPLDTKPDTTSNHLVNNTRLSDKLSSLPAYYSNESEISCLTLSCNQ
jgi:hypothetical protein